MNTLIKTVSAFVYVLIGLFEPAAFDLGSADKKLNISAKIVKSISAIVFVLALVWGLIAIRRIINYFEIVQFLSLFFTFGFFISLVVVFLITRPIPQLKGNKEFLFFTMLSCVLLTPISVDYLNRNLTEQETSKANYEIVNKATKGDEAMFSWVYLKNPTSETKVNVSKHVFDSLTVKDKVEVNIKKGLFDFKFIELIRKP